MSSKGPALFFGRTYGIIVPTPNDDPVPEDRVPASAYKVMVHKSRHPRVVFAPDYDAGFVATWGFPLRTPVWLEIEVYTVLRYIAANTRLICITVLEQRP